MCLFQITIGQICAYRFSPFYNDCIQVWICLVNKWCLYKWSSKCEMTAWMQLMHDTFVHPKFTFLSIICDWWMWLVIFYLIVLRLYVWTYNFADNLHKVWYFLYEAQLGCGIWSANIIMFCTCQSYIVCLHKYLYEKTHTCWHKVINHV